MVEFFSLSENGHFSRKKEPRGFAVAERVFTKGRRCRDKVAVPFFGECRAWLKRCGLAAGLKGPQWKVQHTQTLHETGIFTYIDPFSTTPLYVNMPEPISRVWDITANRSRPTWSRARPLANDQSTRCWSTSTVCF